MVESHLWDTFGRKLGPAGASPLGYGGAWDYQSDGPLGMLQLGHRLYDPEAGRFLSPDPIGHAGGLNLCAYCEGDPVNAVDQMGLFGTGVQPTYDWDRIYRVPQAPARQILGAGLGTLGAPFGYGLHGLVAGSFTGSLLDGEDGVKAIDNAMVDLVLGWVTQRATGGVCKRIGGLFRNGTPAHSAAAVRTPNRLYSARELIRRAESRDAFHNFPGSFDADVFRRGARSVKSGYFNRPKQGYSNDSVMYTLVGSYTGRNGKVIDGVYEIAVRPSTSGNTELIIHRLFRPDRR